MPAEEGIKRRDYPVKTCQISHLHRQRIGKSLGGKEVEQELSLQQVQQIVHDSENLSQEREMGPNKGIGTRPKSRIGNLGGKEENGMIKKRVGKGKGKKRRSFCSEGGPRFESLAVTGLRGWGGREDSERDEKPSLYTESKKQDERSGQGLKQGRLREGGRPAFTRGGP